MFDGHCAYCGCKIEYNEMQIDHVIPLRRGGADTLENMLPACRSCNHYKSTLDVEDFRKMIEKMPDTLMRDSVTYKNAVRFGVVIPNKVSVVFTLKITLSHEKESKVESNFAVHDGAML